MAAIDPLTQLGNFSVQFTRPFLTKEGAGIDANLSLAQLPFIWAYGYLSAGQPVYHGGAQRGAVTLDLRTL